MVVIESFVQLDLHRKIPITACSHSLVEMVFMPRRIDVIMVTAWVLDDLVDRSYGNGDRYSHQVVGSRPRSETPT
jgi:hypothetical protein